MARSTLLKEATAAFDEKRYADVLVACRKVIFVRFESQFDLAPFLNESAGLGLLFTSRVPSFARKKEFVEKHVKEPFDYIYPDHSVIGDELRDYGIDSTTFFNVWRLTPAVYRKDPKSEWLVKHDLAKLEKDGLEDRAAYVLENTIDIALRISASKRSAMWTETRFYAAKLKSPNVKVYSRADRNSLVSCTTLDGLTEIHVTSATPGLNESGYFWEVFQQGESLKDLIHGYIHEDDIEFDD